MRRDAGFTAFAILIAGLGIGASATVFSVVNALLLRPLPFHDPKHLVWIENQEWSMQVSQFLDFRERNKSFSDLLLLFPALRLFPGQSPAQELRFFSLGKVFICPPVSARMIAALVSPMAGTDCTSSNWGSSPAL
jgi:hypothetical protein